MNETATVKRHQFSIKHVFKKITQMAYYTLAFVSIAYTFMSFGFMAYFGGEVTLNSNSIGEMWFEIGMFVVLGVLAACYLWSGIEKSFRRTAATIFGLMLAGTVGIILLTQVVLV